ncbi:hypothetical protein GA0074695_4397 [Micromonospora viridifaciens]|uniref:Uncharacterized protein n=1 Tax=Micromonospora viridifaciens TaxID=1881 RepID=A0A1C4YKZ0_MICVI|nr:hypothetical protein [Micromonospora viridifaciens]SCF21347.1 hypothetical protein GA0074695_4397 [Micromonospora viridifaciens]
MADLRLRLDVASRTAWAMLVVVAVLTALRQAGRARARYLVVGLARVVPGCVPAWSADRAPPGRTAA